MRTWRASIKVRYHSAWIQFRWYFLDQVDQSTFQHTLRYLLVSLQELGREKLKLSSAVQGVFLSMSHYSPYIELFLHPEDEFELWPVLALLPRYEDYSTFTYCISLPFGTHKVLSFNLLTFLRSFFKLYNFRQIPQKTYK